MILFVGARAKAWAYLMDNGSEIKKAKGTKSSTVKKILWLKIMKIVWLIIKSY